MSLIMNIKKEEKIHRMRMLGSQCAIYHANLFKYLNLGISTSPNEGHEIALSPFQPLKHVLYRGFAL